MKLSTRQGKNIAIEGRIDRIDRDPINKKFIIIDYKTGRAVLGSAILKGKSLQIPLYILASEQNFQSSGKAMGGLFANLSTLSKKDGLVRTEAATEFALHPSSSSYVTDAQWDELFQTLPEKVEELVTQAMGGHFPLREEECPPHCPFQEACRVQEQERLPHDLD